MSNDVFHMISMVIFVVAMALVVKLILNVRFDSEDIMEGIGKNLDELTVTVNDSINFGKAMSMLSDKMDQLIVVVDKEKLQDKIKELEQTLADTISKHELEIQAKDAEISTINQTLLETRQYLGERLHEVDTLVKINAELEMKNLNLTTALNNANEVLDTKRRTVNNIVKQAERFIAAANLELGIISEAKTQINNTLNVLPDSDDMPLTQSGKSWNQIEAEASTRQPKVITKPKTEKETLGTVFLSMFRSKK